MWLTLGGDVACSHLTKPVGGWLYRGVLAFDKAGGRWGCNMGSRHLVLGANNLVGEARHPPACHFTLLFAREVGAARTGPKSTSVSLLDAREVGAARTGSNDRNAHVCLAVAGEGGGGDANNHEDHLRLAVGCEGGGSGTTGSVVVEVVEVASHHRCGGGPPPVPTCCRA